MSVLAGSGRRLAGAAAIVMAAYVSSRLSGLLREIAISYRFGTGRELDAYLAANRVPDLVFQIVAGAAVASAFIPVYSSYLARNDREGAAAMVDTLFTLAIVGLLPVIAVIVLLAPTIMSLLVPNFPPEYQVLAANLARIVLLAPIFFTIGCFCTSVLNAHGRFLLAALAPTCYNLGIIVGALIFSRWLGIYGLALGALTGSVFFLLVQLPGLRLLGVSYRPRLLLSHRGVRGVARLMGPRALGLAVTQVNFVVTLYLASGIAGGVAALNYAWILTMLPLGVFAMAISTAVFPSLAAQGAVENHYELRRMVQDALRFILFLTIPAIVGLIVLSPSIVRLIYQRGEFTAQSTATTADALRFYALGLLGMASVEIVTRAFYALHDTATPVKVAALGMAVNLTLGIVLVRVMGINGLALATAAASTVEAIALCAVGQRRISGPAPSSLGVSALKSLTAAAVMAFALWLFGMSIEPLLGAAAPAVAVGSAILLGGSVYLIATVALRSPETHQLRRMMPK
jgi:putative peptidoglycan lipid II flippase